MTSRADQIQASIARVLRDDWNPIGGEGLPHDEYDGYVRSIYRLLMDGAPPMRVAACLAELERVSMGLPPRDVGQLLPVARKLCALEVRSRL